ncbi:DUF3017 domain-containing protein [Micrococcales bacterium 31B]|nr:DUF3017 domain-containing protein [Micrococcales bacterium 31B]
MWWAVKERVVRAIIYATPWGRFRAGCKRQWPIIVTSCGFALAGLLVFSDNSRLACLVTVLTLLVAAALRLALPREALGVLVVRSRATDVALLLLWAVTLAGVALPPPNLWAH